MLVQVVFGDRNGFKNCKWYTYTTDIEDLQIGDVVLVPPTYYSEVDQEVTVVSLTSDYEGPVKPLVGLIRRKDGIKMESIHLSNPYQEVINRVRAEKWSQRQDSITDQLIDVLPLIFAIGCHDAGEVIKRFIEQREQKR